MKESITLKPTTTNLYLCSWNGVGITDVFVQIHTKETLYNEYKDTNLFDDCIDYMGLGDTYKNLHELFKEWEEKKWDMDYYSYTEHNFTIQLIKGGVSND
mgnify:CR=1 FL=1